MSPRLGPGSDFTYTAIADADRLHFIYTERWFFLHLRKYIARAELYFLYTERWFFALVYNTIFAALRADAKVVIIRI